MLIVSEYHVITGIKHWFVKEIKIPMEGTNAKWCHAKSAAYVRDAKPEGDVHSNLPKQRPPLENRDLTLWRFGFRVSRSEISRDLTLSRSSVFVGL